MPMTIDERNAAAAATANDSLTPDEALNDTPVWTKEMDDEHIAFRAKMQREREMQEETDRERHVLAQIVSDVNVRKGYHGDDATSIVMALASASTTYATANVFTYGGKLYNVSVSEQKLYGFELQTWAQELAERNGHAVAMLNINDTIVGSVGVCSHCEELLRLSVRHGANDAILRWCPNNGRDEDDNAF